MFFNKTTVIIQPLSPPFFVKTCHISKNTYLSSFHFCVVVFWVFLCFHVFGGVLQKHLFYASVGPLGLSLQPNIATARAREGQSPACFRCFWLFSLFRFVRLFSVLPCIPLGQKWHAKSYHLLADGCQSAPECEQTIQGRHDERRNDKNNETTKEETTQRQNNERPKHRNNKNNETTHEETIKRRRPSVEFSFGLAECALAL